MLPPDPRNETAGRRLRIEQVAAEQFGSPEKAKRWLAKPNQMLGGRAPLDLLGTEEGALHVESTIMRIAHGIFF